MSTFGAFLDLTADKVLVASLFVCFAHKGFIPLWAVLVVLARDFIIMGVRCLAAAEGTVIAPNRWGGLKIIATFVAMLAIIAHVPGALHLVTAAVGLTVVSGAVYVYEARDLLLKDIHYAPADIAATTITRSVSSRQTPGAT